MPRGKRRIGAGRARKRKKPKAPPSEKALYFQDVLDKWSKRPEYITADGVNTAKIRADAKEMFETLDEETQDLYRKRYEAAVAVYDKELAKYSKYRKSIDKVHIEYSLRSKDLGNGSVARVPPPPKRPLTAYFRFCREHRGSVNELPEMQKTNKHGVSVKDTKKIFKRLSAMWATASQEDKDRYKAEHAADKATYDTKMRRHKKAVLEADKIMRANMRASVRIELDMEILHGKIKKTIYDHYEEKEKMGKIMASVDERFDIDIPVFTKKVVVSKPAKEKESIIVDEDNA